MEIRQLRMQLGDTQSEFAARYHIPFRTVQNWETGTRIPPLYLTELLENKVNEDLVNHKTAILPKYDPHKENLPKLSKYISTISWLKDVSKCMNNDVVFALDEALMGQGYFGGRDEEFLVWVYGSNSVLRFNGVVILGNHISPHDIVNKDGLLFTNFNRTLTDSLANEDILDMQGITEALSDYYYSNSESFEGLYVPPKYQKRFDELADDAIHYYDS